MYLKNKGLNHAGFLHSTAAIKPESRAGQVVRRWFLGETRVKQNRHFQAWLEFSQLKPARNSHSCENDPAKTGNVDLTLEHPIFSCFLTRYLILSPTLTSRVPHTLEGGFCNENPNPKLQVGFLCQVLPKFQVFATPIQTEVGNAWNFIQSSQICLLASFLTRCPPPGGFGVAQLLFPSL